MARLKERLAAAAEGPSDSPSLLTEGNERFARIPLVNIEPDPDQPRKSIRQLDDLVASVKEHGIIQPIVVSPHGEEMFRIIAGERRFSAAKKLGLETVPAIIRTVDEHRRLEIQIIENIHREDLNPLEEAEAFRRLMEEFQLSQRKLAERIGKSAASINETLRILTLPGPILESVRTSEHLTRSVLLEIAKQGSEPAKIALWRAALDGTLTVKAARKAKAPGETPQARLKTRVPIQTESALVVLTFEAESRPGDEEIVRVLHQAIAAVEGGKASP